MSGSVDTTGPPSAPAVLALMEPPPLSEELLADGLPLPPDAGPLHDMAPFALAQATPQTLSHLISGCNGTAKRTIETTSATSRFIVLRNRPSVGRLAIPPWPSP